MSERETQRAVESGDEYEFRSVIAANRLDVLRGNLRRLNRKAAKHGVAAFRMTIGRFSEEFLENRSEGFAAHVKTVQVTLSGQRFSLGKYRVGAELNHRDDTFQAFGGFKIPGKYVGCQPSCDHCQTARDRATTYLLESADGELKQVGASCVEEFSGVAPEHALAATSIWAEFAAMQEELQGESPKESAIFHPAMPLEPFLAIVSRRIRQEGWVSSSVANANREAMMLPDKPTARAALEEIEDLVKRSKCDLVLSPDVDPQDLEIAAAALAHARASYADIPDRLEVEAFDANMWSVARNDVFVDKHAGFAAFIVRKYESEVLEPRRREAQSITSTHVGTEGKRDEFTVTVGRKIPMEGAYGIRMLCLMSDQHGNQLRWVASGNPDIEVGKTYLVKATVKKHDEYKGILQTHLSRVAPVREIESSPEQNAPVAVWEPA